MSLLHANSVSHRVPMHWNLSGQVDQYGSRSEALYFMPILLAFMAVVFGLVGVVSGSRLKANAAKGINVISVASVASMLLLHNTMISQNPSVVPAMLPVLLSALLVVMGFAIKGVEPNPFIGIRVPWTMSSPMVWRLTHERASRLWIIGGVLGLVFAIVGAPLWVSILILAGCTCYPLLDSYRISKSG